MARNLNQDITRWTTQRTFEGMSFGTPEIIKGRWENRWEQFIGNTGKEELSNAMIALNTAVEVSDYLYEGSTTEADPRNLSGAYEVKKYNEMKDLRNTTIERIAIL